MYLISALLLSEPALPTTLKSGDTRLKGTPLHTSSGRSGKVDLLTWLPLIVCRPCLIRKAQDGESGEELPITAGTRDSEIIEEIQPSAGKRRE